MKDVIGFGSLSISLFFQIKNPEVFGKEIKDFNAGGINYGTSEHFQHYLDFLSRIGRKVWQHGGGEEANTVLTLAKMGFDVGFVGKVGEDKFGDFLIEGLEGIDTSRIGKGGFSGISLELLPEKGNRSSLVFSNTNDALPFEEIDLDYISNTRFFHMGSFVGDISFATQKQIVQEIAPRVRICYRVGNSDAQRGLQEILPLIAKSQTIFLTSGQLSLLTGKEYQTGTRQLLAHGCTNVVCRTQDYRWYVVSTEEEFLTPPQSEPKPEDTSDGTSVFVAGFLAGLLLEKSLGECAAIAVELEAGSSSILHQKRFPSREQLEMIIAEREQLKHTD